MSLDALYTAEATSTGGGRDGHVRSSDGRIDLDTRPPKSLGGNGEGTNPEQLFAAGYSACFLSALRLVAGIAKVKLDGATTVTARVGLFKTPEGGFDLAAELEGYLPGLAQDVAEDLVEQAHEVCPYSNATRGNIEVTVKARV